MKFITKKMIRKSFKSKMKDFRIKIFMTTVTTISDCSMECKQVYAEKAIPVFHTAVIREYDRWSLVPDLPKELRTVISDNRDEFIKLVESGKFDVDIKLISTLKSKSHIKSTRQKMFLWLKDKDERFAGRIVGILIPEER